MDGNADAVVLELLEPSPEGEEMTLAAPGVFRRPFSLLAFHARLVAAWEADVIAHNMQIDSSGYAYEKPENLHEACLSQFTPKARSLAR